ncbi:MAG: trypsin-like peptidase domain-containing protein, partial [Bacteroidales bacterium]|nr:trypsin-like peptidase domain-containing protein [Bacteroidales bacterium]
QINIGGQPISFILDTALKSELVFEIMPTVDVESLIAEDKINDQYKDIPWRFGFNIEVDYSMENTGVWDVLPKGDKLWRLGIKSEGAYTINLIFDNYYLPPEAKLFVYNADKSQIIGAFTDFNNQEDRYFATTLISGDAIIIEYYEPHDTEFSGELQLESVTHGYRDAYGYAKAFGSSGSCNNNVICPEAAGWENQISSVCMLVSGGNGFCTGALVNNTNEDGTPYILTADHCYSNPSSWVFWFNWESPTCTNPTSAPPYDALSGAVLRARNSASDFCLVEINSVPPTGYSVYYAGWNRQDATDNSAVAIHHPSGDIKKISFENDPYSSDYYLGSSGIANSHWKITDWDDGTTEPGSSGSPLFDPNQRIIGQLHGGYAACGNDLADWYGKFSMSWNYGGSSSNQLVNWLDPSGISGLTQDGYNPNTPTVLTANFYGSPTTVVLGNTVTFTDLSGGPNPVTSYSWSFPGGTPSSANTAGPHSISYNALGTYNVSLTVGDGIDTNTELKTNYITVTNCIYCPSTYSDLDDDYISNVTFNTINNSSGGPAIPDSYEDFTSISTDVEPGNTYSISVSIIMNGNWTQYARAFFDWNQDCDFIDSGESYYLGQVTNTGTINSSITVPATASAGTTRMRIVEQYSTDPTSPCDPHNTTYGSTEDYSINVLGHITLDLKVQLEGPFNGTNMDANIIPHLPLSQPFNIPPWNYAGTESVGSIPNANVVDWVLIDVRDAALAGAATGGTSVAKQAAFVLNDGSIVGLDGSSTLLFDVSISQNLFVVVWQRNHLGIMSNDPLTPAGGLYIYDFTTGINQVFGGIDGHKQISIGIWGMIGGDGNHDGQVDSNDKSPLWEGQAGERGYLFGDHNLDGESNNQDK